MASIVSTGTEGQGRVLLLGGDGRLGAMLRAHWPEAGDLVVQSRQAGPLRFDPLNAAALRAAARGARAILCLAGVTPARAARTGDAMSLNADLACAAVAASGGARVFLASSAAVYGAQAGLCREADAPRPLSEYGCAKLDMERRALALGAGRGVPVTALRIGNVAGADAILGSWRQGMTLDRFEDGATPARSYIGPVTLARVLHRLTRQASLPEILNIAAPGTVAMGSLLDAARLPWTPRTAGAGAVRQVALDVSRLRRYVTLAPEDSTAAGLVAEWRRS